MPSPLSQKQSILPHILAALLTQGNNPARIDKGGIVREEFLGRGSNSHHFHNKKGGKQLPKLIANSSLSHICVILATFSNLLAKISFPLKCLKCLYVWLWLNGNMKAAAVIEYFTAEPHEQSVPSYLAPALAVLVCIHRMPR